MTFHAAPLMLGALCVLTIAYRYYSAFIAARVLVLDATRMTPAHRFRDGHNFLPTHRWVLFGHHFAAISGSGPLIGPTLAAQFGFAPGFLWLLAGVVLAGAVHDFVILVASTRRDGKSLATIARDELGPVVGVLAMAAIITIVVVSMAGLGIVVVGALSESAWGTFTIAATIPIAILMGLYTHVLRRGAPGAVTESTLGGIALLVVALWLGKEIQDSAYAEWFRFTRTQITFGIAVYGFFASVLPVWLLLVPRDYLSSYLKIGTIAVLVLGVIVVNPVIQAPMVSEWIHGGGPIVKGPLFPFVFVTIACGAISGFHSLVSSGTTPKMLDRETDARAIGYGAMLMEGLVGITALLAATSLPVDDYLAINTDPAVALIASDAGAAGGPVGPAGSAGSSRPAGALVRNPAELATLLRSLRPEDRSLLGIDARTSAAELTKKTYPLSTVLSLSNRALASVGYHVDPNTAEPTSLVHEDFARLGVPVMDLPALAQSTHERIAARTGGGVSLAVGMARIFSGLPIVRNIKGLLAYWYHFAIMFEALFILTTIDAGTRIGRFLVQEVLGKKWPALGASSSVWGGTVATTLVVVTWTTILLTGSVQTIWPMFGIANQLLAVIALAVGTTVILRTRPPRYALVTLLPCAFVATTTITAGLQGVCKIYWPLTYSADPAKVLQGWVDTVLTLALLVSAVVILAHAVRTWARLLRSSVHAATSVVSA